MTLTALFHLWAYLSPHHRRIRAKRQLEAVLREHGIPRKLAATITNHYFRKVFSHD